MSICCHVYVGLFLLLIAGRTLASAPVQLDADRVRASAETWKIAREVCGGNYTYEVTRSSFSGARQTTTVVVKNNEVVERRFQEFGGRPLLPPAPGEEPVEAKPTWIELGKDIGSNMEPSAAAPRTMDELYQQAMTIAEAVVPPDHRRVVGFDADGILAYCFTQDTRIADDAPIRGVPPLKLKQGQK